MTSTSGQRRRFDFSYAAKDLAEALKAHRPETPKSLFQRTVPSWVYLPLVIAILFVFTKKRSSGQMIEESQPETMWWQVALPWLTVIAFLYFCFFFAPRRRARKAWDASERLHYPKVLEIGGDGLSFEDQSGFVMTKWTAFRRYLETPRLFLLYTSPIEMTMIPKRLFSGREDIDWFRGLLQTEITERRANAMIGGFPVQPPAIKRSEVDPPS